MSLSERDIDLLLNGSPSPSPAVTSSEIETNTHLDKPKKKKKLSRSNQEVLTQEEIDSLLAAVQSGEAILNEFSFAKETPLVRIYDFRRQNVITERQRTSLRIIHEKFTRLLAIHFISYLQTSASIYVGFVDILKYDEVIRFFPNPTTIACIAMDPLDGPAFIEIDPQTSFAIIDKLLGGTTHNIEYINRDLSDIEMALLESQIVRMLGCLRESWGKILDLRPRLTHIETNPLLLNALYEDDLCILISLESRIGGVDGMLNLVFPYKTIQPIINKLDKIHLERQCLI